MTTTILAMMVVAAAVAVGMAVSASFKAAMMLVMTWTVRLGLVALGFYVASVVGHLAR